MDDKARYYKVRCPNCGHFFKVRILRLDGSLRLSVFCPDCKRASTIELQDIEAGIEATDVSAGQSKAD
jgi:ribosomal protein S27E